MLSFVRSIACFVFIVSFLALLASFFAPTSDLALACAVIVSVSYCVGAGASLVLASAP